MPTTAASCLDSYASISTKEPAVLDISALDAACGLAAYDKTAMGVSYNAIAGADVLGSLELHHLFAASAFHGDSIVTNINVTAPDLHVYTGLDINAIGIWRIGG